MNKDERSAMLSHPEGDTIRKCVLTLAPAPSWVTVLACYGVTALAPALFGRLLGLQPLSGLHLQLWH